MPDFDLTLTFNPNPAGGLHFYDANLRDIYDESARGRRRLRGPQDVLEPIRQVHTSPEAMQTTMAGIRAVRERGRDASLPVRPAVPDSYVNFLGLLRQIDPQSQDVSAARHMTVGIALQTHGVTAQQIVEMIKDFGVIGDTEIADVVFSEEKRRSILATLLTLERQMGKDEALEVVDQARAIKPEKVAAFIGEEVLTGTLNGAAMTTMVYGMKAVQVKSVAAGAAAHAAHAGASIGMGAKAAAMLKAGVFGGLAGVGALALISCAISTAKMMAVTIPERHPEAFVTTKGGDKAILKAILERGKFA